MTDEELCDALVEEGILHKHPAHGDYALSLLVYQHVGVDAETILSDWRTAGACLEQFTGLDIERLGINSSWWKSPRAIITAFVESLND